MSSNGNDFAISCFEEHPGLWVIAVRGEIDCVHAPSVDASVEEVLGRQPVRIVFDLAGVEFMDSSGLAVLLRAKDRVPDICLRRPPRLVTRLLTLTGTSHAFTVEP